MAEPLTSLGGLRKRVAAMSLRERLLVTAAIVAILYAVADAAYLGPAQARLTRLAKEDAQNRNQAAQTQVQLAALRAARKADPDVQNKERATQLSSQVAELDRQIREQSARFVAPQAMGQVLKSLLANRSRVHLVEMKTLPQSVINLGAQNPAAANNPDAARPRESDAPANLPSILYRHGMQLTLRGEYLDLLAYLKDIEALPSRFYWEKLDLAVAEHPISELVIVLNTVGLDRAWMRI